MNTRNTRPAERLATLLPLSLGLLAFLLIAGPRVLDPTNLAWLQGNDPSTQYLGWLFFRQADWSFPLGMNPDYGLEIANSIVYSDSVPLLAFLFKPFDAWLPQPFQYLGMWLLACFVLQAFFAWKLTGLITSSNVLRLLASTLFVFSPPMLTRLAGHWALVGHFLILAALYLALRPCLEKRRLAWAVLLIVVALVHAYLLAMVGLIWLADLAGRTWWRNISLKAAALELAGFFSLVIATCWQAGYFSVDEGLFSGNFYGYFRANLLTLLDSSGWSYLLRNIPEGGGDYEGFNYLGLGSILLAVAGLPLLSGLLADVKAATVRHCFLLLALLGLAAFSFTHNLAAGNLVLTYPLPDVLLQKAEMFRSSGRMFWPVFYLVVLMIVCLIVKGSRHNTAAGLLALAVAVQVLDTHAGWSVRREALMVKRQASLAITPSDPFWEQAARRYDKVRVLPPANQPKYWANIASFAGAHGMATNAVYLAKINLKGFASATNNAASMMASGNYDEDTLYILDESVVEQVRTTIQSQSDLMTTVDGLVVLAPSWLE